MINAMMARELTQLFQSFAQKAECNSGTCKWQNMFTAYAYNVLDSDTWCWDANILARQHISLLFLI